MMTVAICISTLASIPSAMITYCLMNEPHAFFHALLTMVPFYMAAVPIHGFILVNLFISALFGWLMAVGLTRRSRRTSPAEGNNVLENRDQWEQMPTRML